MEPTRKDSIVESMLTAMFGFDRTETIRNNLCSPAPYGCSKKIDPDTEFRDEPSKREYQISGLCQSCQDEIFGKEEDFRSPCDRA